MQLGTIMSSHWSKPKVALLVLSLKVSGRQVLASVVLYQKENFESANKIKVCILRV